MQGIPWPEPLFRINCIFLPMPDYWQLPVKPPLCTSIRRREPACPRSVYSWYILGDQWEVNRGSFSLGCVDLPHEYQSFVKLASLSVISANSASFACPQVFILTAMHSEFPAHKSMTQSLFPRKPELHYGLKHASLLWQPVPVHLRIFERVPVICQIFTVESVNTAGYNKYQEQFHKCQNENVLLIFKGTI